MSTWEERQGSRLPGSTGQDRKRPGRGGDGAKDVLQVLVVTVAKLAAESKGDCGRIQGVNLPGPLWAGRQVVGVPCEFRSRQATEKVQTQRISLSAWRYEIVAVSGA